MPEMVKTHFQQSVFSHLSYLKGLKQAISDLMCFGRTRMHDLSCLVVLWQC